MTPNLDSNSDAKILQIFFATLFCKPTKLTLLHIEVIPLGVIVKRKSSQSPVHPPITFQALLEVITPSVIPFWKPLMTLYKNCNSVSKFLANFLQPYFANLQ